MAFGFADVEVIEWDGSAPTPPLSSPIGPALIAINALTRIWSISFNGGAYVPIGAPDLPVATPNLDAGAAPNSVVKFQTLTQPVTLTLPAAPTAGQFIYVKAGPNSTEFPVTIDGNGQNIDGASNFVLDVNRQAVTLVYDGTEWGIW